MEIVIQDTHKLGGVIQDTHKLEVIQEVHISQQSCHRLHGKAATHFTAKLPPITRESCHL